DPEVETETHLLCPEVGLVVKVGLPRLRQSANGDDLEAVLARRCGFVRHPDRGPLGLARNRDAAWPRPDGQLSERCIQQATHPGWIRMGERFPLYLVRRCHPLWIAVKADGRHVDRYKPHVQGGRVRFEPEIARLRVHEEGIGDPGVRILTPVLPLL